MRFRSTKTYGHEQGLSACFRQHAATSSHCSFLHGYALSVRLEFGADKLDHRNWVVDFGGLKPVKRWLQDMFDHKTIVAADDPELQAISRLAKLGVIDIRVVPRVGCEAFAEMIYKRVAEWLEGQDAYANRVALISVEVREHAGNSAICYGVD